MRWIFALLLLVFQLSCEGPKLPSGMPTPITPAVPPPIELSFNGPADGELATAATVNVPFQTIQNDVEAFRLLTYGGGFYVNLSATSSTNMVIQPLGAVVVKVAGTWKVYEHSLASTINPQALHGGVLAASTRYFVYAYVSAGVLTFQVTVDTPDANRRYKSGDEQYQYITTFYTDHTAALLPYNQAGREYQFASMTAAGGGARGNLILEGNALAVTPFTTVGSAIPTNAISYTLSSAAIATANNALAVYGLALPSSDARFHYPINSGWVAFTQQASWAGQTTTLDYFVDAATTQLDVWARSFVY